MVDRHPLEVLLKLDRNFRSGLSSTNSVPCGLKNLGNTCYLNACLQMLSAASGFVNTFGGADVDESLPARALPNSEAGATELKNSIVGELQKILGSMTKFKALEPPQKDGALQSASPRLLLSRISRLYPEFKGFKQQDAHECLVRLLDIVDEMTSVPVPPRKEHYAHGSKGKVYQESLVRDLFGGGMKSTVTCSACGNKSVTNEDFLCISLPILFDTTTKRQLKRKRQKITESPKNVAAGYDSTSFFSSWWNWLGSSFSQSPSDPELPRPDGCSNDGTNRKAATLPACLESMFSEEILDSRDRNYKCSSCHKRTSASKSLIMHGDPPECLLLHLKRFQYESFFSREEKEGTAKSVMEGADENAQSGSLGGFASFSNVEKAWTSGGEKMRSVKLKNLVDFPVRGLTVPGDQTGAVYDLVGVVEHIGDSVKSGHYVAYVKHNMEATKQGGAVTLEDGDEFWYKCNDSKVTIASEAMLKDVEAYLLLYSKRHVGNVPRTGTTTTQSLREELVSSMKNEVDPNSSPRPGPKAYISSYWLRKFIGASFPGPVSNYRNLCRHNKALERDQLNFVPLPKTLCKRLIQEYGQHGPCPLSKVNLSCFACNSERASWDNQRKEDNAFFGKIFRLGKGTNSASSGELLYLVDEAWLKRWRVFLLNDHESPSFSRMVRTVHGTDGSSGIPPPGPISNERLLQGDAAEGKLKPGLCAGKDYRGVNKDCWDHFYERYGGGPVITRRSLHGVL